LMVDDPITRREFDRVVQDHERRLDGHDGLYGDLRDTREELVRFTEALKAARDEIMSGVTDRDLCKAECAEHRSGFEKRTRCLEQFRWQISGALLVIGVVWPAIIKWG
jgi:hypothetical protein